MLLNAQIYHSNSIGAMYSDYSVKLGYENSSSSLTPYSTPSPASSKTSASPKSIVSVTKEKRTFDLPCAICGSPATGYHYNVASCNGCKTFFRRCVLSRSSFRCIRSDSKCLANLQSYAEGERIKCRSCRLDRCLHKGMRKEAVTSNTVLSSPTHTTSSQIAASSYPSTSTAVQKINEIASSFRHTFRLIRTFRRSSVNIKELDVDVAELLRSTHFLDNVRNSETIQNFTNFKRALPQWLTIDLVCAIEFAKRLEDMNKFTFEDQLELLRSSCFTLAIAFQAIDSYFEEHQKVIMPDGTNILEAIGAAGTKIDTHYWQMFASILDPLYREKFTIDELVSSLQLLFFTIASPDSLSKQGQIQLEQSIAACRQNMFIFLVNQDKTKFPARYGALTSLNETFVTIAALHRQKMQANDHVRQKLKDYLIEQLVFDYRPEHHEK